MPGLKTCGQAGGLVPVRSSSNRDRVAGPRAGACVGAICGRLVLLCCCWVPRAGCELAALPWAWASVLVARLNSRGRVQTGAHLAGKSAQHCTSQISTCNLRFSLRSSPKTKTTSAQPARQLCCTRRRAPNHLIAILTAKPNSRRVFGAVQPR